MNGMIKIILTGKPESTGSLYRAGKTRDGKPYTYMTEDGKNLKGVYLWQVIAQYKKKPLQGKLAVQVDLYFPDLRRRDIDNFFKIALDSLSKLVWEDDSQIWKLTTTKNIDKANPRIELTIDKY